MPFISVTRLRLRSPIYLPLFFWYTFTSAKQLVNHSSFIKGKTLLDRKLTFWTMTAWQNEGDMRAYRNSDAHKKAMPKLQHWCDEASVVHWHQEDDVLPDWLTAHRLMVTDGRISKVKHPSPEHSNLQQIAPPRYPSETERLLTPKRR